MLYSEFIDTLKIKNYTIHEGKINNKSCVYISMPKTNYKLKIRNDNYVLSETNDEILKTSFENLLNFLENIEY